MCGILKDLIPKNILKTTLRGMDRIDSTPSLVHTLPDTCNIMVGTGLKPGSRNASHVSHRVAGT